LEIKIKIEVGVVELELQFTDWGKGGDLGVQEFPKLE
jgi:hypothetical protein